MDVTSSVITILLLEFSLVLLVTETLVDWLDRYYRSVGSDPAKTGIGEADSRFNLMRCHGQIGKVREHWLW